MSPNPCALPQLNHVFDIHQHWQCHTARGEAAGQRAGAGVARPGPQRTDQRTSTLSSARDAGQGSKVAHCQFGPDAEGRLHGKPQQGKSIKGKGLTDLGPVTVVQEVAVGRLLQAQPQVHQNCPSSPGSHAGAAKQRAGSAECLAAGTPGGC